MKDSASGPFCNAHHKATFTPLPGQTSLTGVRFARVLRLPGAPSSPCAGDVWGMSTDECSQLRSYRPTSDEDDAMTTEPIHGASHAILLELVPNRPHGAAGGPYHRPHRSHRSHRPHRSAACLRHGSDQAKRQGDPGDGEGASGPKTGRGPPRSAADHPGRTAADPVGTHGGTAGRKRGRDRRGATEPPETETPTRRPKPPPPTRPRSRPADGPPGVPPTPPAERPATPSALRDHSQSAVWFSRRLRQRADRGRLAQRESASFTPKRSLVRSQYRPPRFRSSQAGSLLR